MHRVTLILLMAAGLAASGLAQAQAQDETAADPTSADHSDAYYHYVMAHLYAEKAMVQGAMNDSDGLGSR